MPAGFYNPRGPWIVWDSNGVAEVPLAIPSQADHVEIYASYDRVSYNGYSCYMDYDLMNCPDYSGISGDYVSNFGRNFSLLVQ